ncbi:MAG: GNAT family N-acetyltransferase [Tepidisphaeraceae bacterium]
MNRLLIDFVEQIETPRLVLRIPRPGEGGEVYETVRTSFDELHAWMPWATKQYGPEEAEAWCRKVRGDFLHRHEFHYMLRDRATGEHLGAVSAHHVDFEVPKCEIGYWLRTDRTGRGYMTEAVRALAEYLTGAHAFRRLAIRCDDENSRSARVAELCGFEFEGTHRCEVRDHHARLRDYRVYARVSRGAGK